MITREQAEASLKCHEKAMRIANELFPDSVPPECILEVLGHEAHMRAMQTIIALYDRIDELEKVGVN